MEEDRQKGTRDLETEVRKYYDDNTKMFLKLGEHSSASAIHQPLYLESNDDPDTAIHVQHEIILQAIRERTMSQNTGGKDAGDPCTVLDLGCGVGSSIFYLAQRTGDNVRFAGVTLSQEQYRRAAAVADRLGFRERIRIHQASFQDLPNEIRQVDMAFAIESFIHATDISGFFKEVSGIINRDGRLLIFDDFLKSTTEPFGHDSLRDFRNYWHAHTLVDVEAAGEIAGHHGFSKFAFTDYTGALRLNRPRDKFIRVIAPVAKVFAKRSSYCTFLVGGNARQQAYRDGLLRYGLLDLAYHPSGS